MTIPFCALTTRANHSRAGRTLICSLIASLLIATLGHAASLTSPNGRVELEVSGDDQRGLTYSVRVGDKSVIVPSSIKLIRDDGTAIGENLASIEFAAPTASRTEWQPVYGERSTVVDDYKELIVRARDTKADCLMAITFRCYDTGVAFQTEIAADTRFAIKSERTEFRFPADVYGWRTHRAQGEYDKVRISEMGEDVARPLVLEIDDSTYAAIAEAKLVDYARMRLQTSKTVPNCLVSQLASKIDATRKLTTPWRVVMLADSPGGLLEGNDLLLNLNEPNQIADTSWIKPGKVLRDITLTTEGGYASIDYAVKHNFKYIEFDAGWYGHEYDASSDATTISVDPKRSPGPLDLLELIEYAEEREIGVILYVNRRALEKQLDDILPLYKSWGVKGVKYGFVQVGPQKWTRWLHDAVRKAADHQLLVDIHDNYRPTGYSRTYPNLMTQEGVYGDEATPSSEQALMSLFTRSLAGATDFTVCYFDSRVAENWSHAQQLAKAVCFYSPWQFLFWYDSPIKRNPDGEKWLQETPEQEFFKHTPTTWDETRVLHGAIGEYAVIARRSGDDWFIGAMNNQTARTLDTPLDFLNEGQRYEATIYSDDAAVDTPTHVRIDRQTVDSRSVLSIVMQSNGGQAIRITPVP